VTGRVVVIGVGNPFRRDDGVGWVVALAAGRRLGETVETRLCDGDPARLLDAWTDVALAVVVDAMRSGARPGAIRVVAADGVSELPASRSPAGSHSLGVGQGLALGRAIGRLPDRLVVIGIEARDHAFGDELSAPVTAAVGDAVDLVVRIVDGDQAGAGLVAASTAGSRDDEHRYPRAGDHGLAGRTQLAQCAADSPAADDEQLGVLALRDP
jgi:hydrogenase maturation protease